MVFCVSLCFACTEMVDDINDDNLKSGHLGSDKDGDMKMVQVPFKADFRVWKAVPTGSGEACDIGWVRETMEGEGNITHLGKIKTFMTFCVYVEDDTSPDFLSYAFTELGYFVAANGDTLYVNIPEGQIIPAPAREGYHAHFNDSMFFMGGTGRFEGAMGYALTNAHPFFDNPATEEDEFFTDFFSEGILKLKKEKR